MKNNNRILFISLIILLFLEIIVSKYVLNTKEMLYNLYVENLTRKQVNAVFKFQDKWDWLGYAIIPLLILIRSSLVSLCLSVGLFFYDSEEDEVKFNQLFRVALLGEFVLVLVGYFKFLYFAFIKTEYTLQDVQQFYPFSYTNFLDLESIQPWLIYPLQTINLFEIAYFFVLVYGLHKLLKNKYLKTFEIVAVSYGTGLLIWLGLVSFLTLNIN